MWAYAGSSALKWSFDRVSAWLRGSGHKSVPRFTVTSVFFKRQYSFRWQVELAVTVMVLLRRQDKTTPQKLFLIHPLGAITQSNLKAWTLKNIETTWQEPRPLRDQKHRHIHASKIKSSLSERRIYLKNHQRPNWTQISPPFA